MPRCGQVGFLVAAYPVGGVCAECRLMASCLYMCRKCDSALCVECLGTHQGEDADVEESADVATDDDS